MGQTSRYPPIAALGRVRTREHAQLATLAGRAAARAAAPQPVPGSRRAAVQCSETDSCQGSRSYHASHRGLRRLRLGPLLRADPRSIMSVSAVAPAVVFSSLMLCSGEGRQALHPLPQSLSIFSQLQLRHHSVPWTSRSHVVFAVSHAHGGMATSGSVHRPSARSHVQPCLCNYVFGLFPCTAV